MVNIKKKENSVDMIKKKNKKEKNKKGTVLWEN
jgi:hypothetical protein